MKFRLPSILAAVALLAGCSTPPEIKDVSKILVTDVPKLPVSHADDLKAMADYLEKSQAAQAAVSTEIARANERLKKLADILEQESRRAAGGAVLARWDARAFELMNRDFPAHVTSVYFARINARRDGLQAAFSAATKAREGRPEDQALLSAQRYAALKLVALDNAGNEELILLYDYLHAQLAEQRAQLVRDLSLGEAPPGQALKLAQEALGAAEKTEPAAAGTKPGKTPGAETVAKLRSRAEELTATKEPLVKGLEAVDYYLTTDGYSRVFAKAAVAGLAKGALDPAKSIIGKIAPDIGKLAEKVGLDGAQVTQKLNDEAGKLLQKAEEDLTKKFEGIADQAMTKLNQFFDKAKAKADATADKVLRTAST